MLLHSIVYACRCARVQAEFEAAEVADRVEPEPYSGGLDPNRAGRRP